MKTSGWAREALEAAVRFGHEVLQMQDAAMARELSLSKERIRQVRARLGIELPMCPCGRSRLRAGFDCCKRCSAAADRKSQPCSASCGRRTWRAHPSGKCSICGNHSYYTDSPVRRGRAARRMARYHAQRIGNPGAEAQVGVGFRAAREAIRLWPKGEEITTGGALDSIRRRHPGLALTRLQLHNAFREAKRQGEIETVCRNLGPGKPAVYRRMP